MKIIVPVLSFMIFSCFSQVSFSENWNCRMLPVNKNMTLKSVTGVGGDFCVQFRTENGGEPKGVKIWKIENGKNIHFGVQSDYCFEINGHVKVRVGWANERTRACYTENGGLLSETDLKALIDSFM